MVDIVDWSGLNLPFFMSESMEDRHASNSEAIGQLVIIAKSIGFDIKSVLCFSDGSLVVSKSGIYDVIVVVNSIFVFAFLLMVHLV